VCLRVGVSELRHGGGSLYRLLHIAHRLDVTQQPACCRCWGGRLLGQSGLMVLHRRYSASKRDKTAQATFDVRVASRPLGRGRAHTG
jgi:hypothetical protein